MELSARETLMTMDKICKFFGEYPACCDYCVLNDGDKYCGLEGSQAFDVDRIIKICEEWKDKEVHNPPIEVYVYNISFVKKEGDMIHIIADVDYDGKDDEKQKDFFITKYEFKMIAQMGFYII